jgi:membrane protein implicated in regulation of membrane protease activity
MRERERIRMVYGSLPGPHGTPSLFGRIVATLATLVVFVAAFFFSALVLAGLLTVGVAVWAYFWWRTRGLRRAMREQMAQGAEQTVGEVRIIEGEVVSRERVDEP